MSTGFAELATTASPLSARDDEALYEIVNGKRVELPPMSIYSNRVAFRLSQQLAEFVEKQSLGTVTMEALVILDKEINLRRRPDVTFVSAERWPLDREIPETGDWDVVPDLAIEVTSPNDVFPDVHGKIREYFEHGVREVWVVIPEEGQIYLYTSETKVDIHNQTRSLTSELLPGFELSLTNLFRRTSKAPT